MKALFFTCSKTLFTNRVIYSECNPVSGSSIITIGYLQLISDILGISVDNNNR